MFKQLNSCNPFVNKLIILELGGLDGVPNELIHLPNPFMILYSLGIIEERSLGTYFVTIFMFEREILSKGMCHLEKEEALGH